MYVINWYQGKIMALQAQPLPVRFLVIYDQNVRPFHTNMAGIVPCQTIHGLLEDVKEAGSLLRLPFLTLSDPPLPSTGPHIVNACVCRDRRCRFYEYQSGTCIINGVEYRNCCR